MAKRRKKKSQQFIKQSCAQRKNLYLKELKRAYVLIGCAEAFALIPKSEYEQIYQTRIAPPTVEKNPDHSISSTELKEFKLMFLSHFNGRSLEVPSTGQKLTFNYIFTYVVAIYMYCLTIEQKGYKNASKVKELIDQTIDLDAFINDSLKEAKDVITMMGFIASELSKHMFGLECNFVIKKGLQYCVTFRVKLNKNENETQKLIIDGHKRNIYRVGFPVTDEGIYWSGVKSSELCKNSLLGDMLLPIYIQSHAIQRFEERLDCIESWYRNFCLNTCFHNVQITHFNNRRLIKFITASGYKLGYFLADVIDGIVLIRTFLFITNSGTPEGNKLEQICGLKKQDKQYWAIDKLSTFVESDISENSKLKNLFIEAGCGDLFTFKDQFELNSTQPVKQSRQMLSYINRAKSYQKQLAFA